MPNPTEKPRSLWDATEMDGQTPEVKARKALTHLLHNVRTRPELGYELGLGSAAFGLLTEAYAALTGQPVRKVREAFACLHAKPRGGDDAGRLEWLERRMLEMPAAYGDLLGLPGRWTTLRTAIDEARKREEGR